MNLDDLYIFAKQYGFVYPSGEIYGGIAGFYDFGPLGSILVKNLKDLFWKHFVDFIEYIIPIDGSIITNPKVWDASGHTKKFNDPVLVCNNCGYRTRADTYIEEKYRVNPANLKEYLKEQKIECPNCKHQLELNESFNLMFKTTVGTEDSVFLRPETAQIIFINFKQVYNSLRIDLPFGIAQIGKSFRNEISPRDFLFRLREFEQFEIEFFINPEDLNNCPYYDAIKEKQLFVLTREDQENQKQEKLLKIKELKNKATEWHLYWLYSFHDFFTKYGIKPEHLRLREHLKSELAHYASSCFDIEYKFPFGWKEIHGCANRTDFDLTQHQKYSKTKMEVQDKKTHKRFIPHVIEPSQGIERAVMAFLFEGLENNNSKDNLKLDLDIELVPYQIAILPMYNNENFMKKSKELFDHFKTKFRTIITQQGSLLKRIEYHNTIGTYNQIIIDFQTLEDGSVVIKNKENKKFLRTNNYNLF